MTSTISNLSGFPKKTLSNNSLKENKAFKA
jgi:hypothetical protein